MYRNFFIGCSFSKIIAVNLVQFKKPHFEKYKSYERLNSEDMESVKL